MRRLFLASALLAGVAAADEPWKFSHHQHVVAEELECSDCHNQVQRTTRLLDIRPGVPARTCMQCHDGEKGFEQARPTILLDSSYRIPKRAEKGSLKFSHKAHVDAKVDCSQCHGDAIKDGVKPDAKALRVAERRMSMKSCMECHVSDKKAEVSCLTCHDAVRSPLNHMTAGWMLNGGHGLTSSLKPSDCSMCHDKGAAGHAAVGDCADCHMGGDARKVHGANYRYAHGVDVKFKKMNCSTCHQPLDRFCADCHEGTGRPLR